MKRVVLTADANAELAALPRPVHTRIQGAIIKLAQWPVASNVKALTGQWKGWYRKRVGDYRVRFFLRQPDLLVIDKIGKRGEFYD